MESGLTRNQIISELARSPHGNLAEYLPIGRDAANEQPDFFSHLIAWNQIHGQIRDSKVALPVIVLGTPVLPWDYAENALAHLALLDPRNLLRAVRFAKETGTSRKGRQIRGLVERYIRARELVWPWWERTAMAHRASLKSLYALAHIKPSPMADLILMKGKPPAGTIFDTLKRLKDMEPAEAASIILDRRIPFLVAAGALGARAKEPDTALALIERMSPTELVTNTKMLERWGAKTNPTLRAAYEAGLERAGKSKKTTFKATRAAEAIGDAQLREKLRGVQERQIAAMGSVDGNWLVLGDRSGSMEPAIDTARHIAAALARSVSGKVHLVFFDTVPSYIDATGMDYGALRDRTSRIIAHGGTSIGCGVRYAFDAGLEVDGIAIVSDAAENAAPQFVDEYRRLTQRIGKEPPVYLYRLPVGLGTVHDRDLAKSMQAAGLDLQEFDLRRGAVDYYSLPNLVRTMSTRRYGLVEQIMDTPLLTVAEALKPTRNVAA